VDEKDGGEGDDGDDGDGAPPAACVPSTSVTTTTV
jgi:hypothetical protein